ARGRAAVLLTRADPLPYPPPRNRDRLREHGENPWLPRNCERGRNPQLCHCPSDGWEGAGSRSKREPGDLAGPQNQGPPDGGGTFVAGLHPAVSLDPAAGPSTRVDPCSLLSSSPRR